MTARRRTRNAAVSATINDVEPYQADGVRQPKNAVKGKIGDAVDSVKSAVNGAGNTGSGSASAKATSANGGSPVAKIGDKLASLNDGVASKLGNTDVNGTTQRAIGIAKENPIGLALTALALGFLGGSLLPVLDVERERLGPIREQVVNQAQAATHDLVEAGKAVVAETAQSVVSTALSSAQTHGQEVLDAAKTRADQA